MKYFCNPKFFYHHVESAAHALIGRNRLEDLRAVDEAVFPVTTFQDGRFSIHFRGDTIL
jgi:hypothetical protein